MTLVARAPAIVDPQSNVVLFPQWRLRDLPRNTALVRTDLLRFAFNVTQMSTPDPSLDASERTAQASPWTPEEEKFIVSLIRERRLESTIMLALKLDTLLRLSAKMNGQSFAAHEYLTEKLACNARSLHRARRLLELEYGITKAPGRDGRWNVWQPTTDTDLNLTKCVAVPAMAIQLDDFAFYMLAMCHWHAEEGRQEIDEEEGTKDPRRTLIPLRFAITGRKRIAQTLGLTYHRTNKALSEISALRLFDFKRGLTPENARGTLADFLRKNSDRF